MTLTLPERVFGPALGEEAEPNHESAGSFAKQRGGRETNRLLQIWKGLHVLLFVL
jgi:hypothetical protein